MLQEIVPPVLHQNATIPTITSSPTTPTIYPLTSLMFQDDESKNNRNKVPFKLNRPVEPLFWLRHTRPQTSTVAQQL